MSTNQQSSVTFLFKMKLESRENKFNVDLTYTRDVIKSCAICKIITFFKKLLKFNFKMSLFYEIITILLSLGCTEKGSKGSFKGHPPQTKFLQHDFFA